MGRTMQTSRKSTGVLAPRKRLATSRVSQTPERSDSEESESKWISLGEPDPFRNAVVLMNLFSFLSITDLKSCRLVNQTWNPIALRHLQRRCHACIMRRKNDYASVSVFNFVDHLQAFPVFPFTKLHLEFTRFADFLPSSAWNVLFCYIHLWVTELSIYWVDKNVDLRVPDLESMPCPHLKKLVCIIHGADNRTEETLFPFVTQILKAAPYLRSLKLEAVGHKTLNLLHQLNLKLESLELKLVSGTEAADLSLQALLASQGETLSTLTVSYTFANRVGFPNLAQLRTLLLKQDPLGRLEPLQYGVKMPALKNLILDLNWGELKETSAYLPFNGKTANSVTNLQLLGFISEESQLRPLMLEVIPKVFPYLKSLKIVACPDFVLELVDQLASLEELVLVNEWRDRDAMSRVFTGLTLKECQPLNRCSKQRIRQEQQEFQRKLEEKPYSALHKIRVLRLECNNSVPSQFPLSVSTCRLVFLQMNNLKELQLIGKLPNTKIFETVMQEMKNKFLVLCEPAPQPH